MVELVETVEDDIIIDVHDEAVVDEVDSEHETVETVEAIVTVEHDREHDEVDEVMHEYLEHDEMVEADTIEIDDKVEIDGFDEMVDEQYQLIDEKVEHEQLDDEMVDEQQQDDIDDKVEMH